ncbi:hypothetical protein LPJ64_006394, partial [Coemansia asiatica]
KPTPVVKCDELAAENQNAASEADAEAKAESTIDYCAALSSCRKDMVKTEGLYIVAYGSGPFWKLKESSALRADTFDWLSRITALNNLDIKLLHLAVQYLDHFLTDFDQQIEVDHLRVYAYACLFFAVMSSKHKPTPSLTISDYDVDRFATEHLGTAFHQVAQSLDWCLEMVPEETGRSIRRSVNLPTMFDFLVFIFQRAAIELPERFADPEQEQRDIDAQEVFPIKFAMGPFWHACHFATTLLRDQDCLFYRISELAAACFYLVVRNEGIEPSVFKRCTGRSLTKVQSVGFFAHGV